MEYLDFEKNLMLNQGAFDYYDPLPSNSQHKLMTNVYSGCSITKGL